MHAPTEAKSVSRAVVAYCFGTHPTTISRWVSRDGCPRNEDGSYDLREVNQWALDRAAVETDKAENDEAQRWLTKFRKERALLAEIERKQAEGQLAEWSEIEREWMARVVTVCAGLDALAHRLPPVLHGKDRGEMYATIRLEVRKLREAYAKRGRYCPPPNGETWPESIVNGS